MWKENLCTFASPEISLDLAAIIHSNLLLVLSVYTEQFKLCRSSASPLFGADTEETKKACEYFWMEFEGQQVTTSSAAVNHYIRNYLLAEANRFFQMHLHYYSELTLQHAHNSRVYLDIDPLEANETMLEVIDDEIALIVLVRESLLKDVKALQKFHNLFNPDHWMDQLDRLLEIERQLVQHQQRIRQNGEGNERVGTISVTESDISQYLGQLDGDVKAIEAAANSLMNEGKFKPRDLDAVDVVELASFVKRLVVCAAQLKRQRESLRQVNQASPIMPLCNKIGNRIAIVRSKINRRIKEFIERGDDVIASLKATDVSTHDPTQLANELYLTDNTVVMDNMLRMLEIEFRELATTRDNALANIHSLEFELARWQDWLKLPAHQVALNHVALGKGHRLFIKLERLQVKLRFQRSELQRIEELQQINTQSADKVTKALDVSGRIDVFQGAITALNGRYLSLMARFPQLDVGSFEGFDLAIETLAADVCSNP